MKISNSSPDDSYVATRTKLIAQLDAYGIHSFEELVALLEAERPRTQSEEEATRYLLEMGTSEKSKRNSMASRIPN